ncbi:hypothetical protein A2U01_0098015, partial [Trifolium medium]|nr:hypothetical protein [Trifolium medium]
MVSFFPSFGGYGATIACGFAVVYTSGGICAGCGLPLTIGSFSA